MATATTRHLRALAGLKWVIQSFMKWFVPGLADMARVKTAVEPCRGGRRSA
jgi:hypothetical protein